MALTLPSLPRFVLVGEAPGPVKSEPAQIRHAGSLLGHCVCLLSLPTLCSVPPLFLLPGRHTSPEAPSHFIALRFCFQPPACFPCTNSPSIFWAITFPYLRAAGLVCPDFLCFDYMVTFGIYILSAYEPFCVSC